MFHRSIVRRIGKINTLANYCSLVNSKLSLASSGAGTSPSESEPVSSRKLPPEKDYVISYLMNSCGLSLEKAVSASSKLHLDCPDKANAVLNSLTKVGFSKSQIAELVSRQPRFLLSDPEKTLLPKIEFFLRSSEISDTEMLDVIAKCPYYLTSSLEKQLGPVYEYIKDVVGPKRVDVLLRRRSWIFGYGLENTLIPNVGLLRDLGVPQRCIELIMYRFPDAISKKHDTFKKIVDEVISMGFNPAKTAFVVATYCRIVKRNKESWEKCYETYTNWGWSKDDIYMAFRKHPNCMLLSKEKITRVLDFVVKKLGRDSRSIARTPYIIDYSMEKRVIPRYHVLHHLFLNGFVKKDWSLTSVLCPSEVKFLERYVNRYLEELPQLLYIYKEKTSGGELGLKS